MTSGNGYSNHAKEILRVEDILKKYGISFHVSSVELSLDAPTDQEFQKVPCNLFLKNSTPGKDDFHFVNGERNPKTGRPMPRNKFHPDNENKYVKRRGASVHFKSYLSKRRNELTLTRNFLEYRGLNHFSEVLYAGPILFFNKLELLTFDLQDVLDFRDKSKRLGTNQGLVAMGPIALRNLFQKSSAEILLELKNRLNWKVHRIKKTFARKIDFPPFIIETDVASISYAEKTKNFPYPVNNITVSDLKLKTDPALKIINSPNVRLNTRSVCQSPWLLSLVQDG